MDSDSELKRRVELFLQQNWGSSLSGLSIDVVRGQVVLQGTVSSFYERQLCLCCRHVAGVLRVIDDLKVELDTVRRPATANHQQRLPA